MRDSRDQLKFGFLTYDLQPFTEDCLFRVSQAVKPRDVKAFPVIYHHAQSLSRVNFFESKEIGRYLPVNRKASTPEGFASNINWRAAWVCAAESDVVVLFGLQGATALLTALLATLRGKPLVSVNQTLPVEWELKRRWWVRVAKRWLLDRCSVHVSQTSSTPSVLTQVYGIHPDKIISAPFEAGAEWFRSVLRDADPSEFTAINPQPGEIVILFAGNLHPFKGVLQLLDALARLPDRGKWRCIFAGPEEPGNGQWGSIDSYIRYASDIGVQNYVNFTGRVTAQRLAGLYLRCDIVVLPTYKDCFPKVLVEGALAGKPLITTSANGAAGSMVVDGVNGYIISPGDTVALSERISRLRDPRLRKAMGDKSRQLVNSLCNSEIETSGFVEALNRAAEK